MGAPGSAATSATILSKRARDVLILGGQKDLGMLCHSPLSFLPTYTASGSSLRPRSHEEAILQARVRNIAVSDLLPLSSPAGKSIELFASFTALELAS
jgi:hypothetical protein